MTMCQEKKEEEDLPALKIALIHRYSDQKTTQKSAWKTDYSFRKQC